MLAMFRFAYRHQLNMLESFWNAFSYSTPLKRTRSVHFADEIGRRLIEICSINDDYLCSKDKLASAQFDLIPEPVISTPQPVRPVPRATASWKTDFEQPCNNYNAMREKVERNGISLANVYVNNIRETLTGTVKVKDLPGAKNVFIRYTVDDWATCQDQPCRLRKFNQSDPDDTYTFEIDAMSMNSQTIQFCLGYKIDDSQEFWDNNSSENYKLTNLTNKPSI